MPSRRTSHFTGLRLWLAFFVLSCFHKLPCHSFLPRTTHETVSLIPLVTYPDHSLQRSHFQRLDFECSENVATRQRIALFQSKEGGGQVDGTGGRGLALFGLVLAGCIWVFSIPPEFRRAHFCFVEKCVEERSKCYDCVTFSEWADGISEYYKNGGGVEFDFTVAEETKTFWKDAVSK